MLIAGITYLLATAPNGWDWVSRYSAPEIEELFTAEERLALERGEAVILEGRSGATRYVDMVAAARASL